MTSPSLREMIGQAAGRTSPSVMTGKIKGLRECYHDANMVELEIDYGSDKEGVPTPSMGMSVKLSKSAAKDMSIGDTVRVTTTVEKVA